MANLEAASRKIVVIRVLRVDLASNRSIASTLRRLFSEFDPLRSFDCVVKSSDDVLGLLWSGIAWNKIPNDFLSTLCRSHHSGLMQHKHRLVEEQPGTRSATKVDVGVSIAPLRSLSEKTALNH